MNQLIHNFRYISVIFALFILSGCNTDNSPEETISMLESRISDLENRVNELESAIDESIYLLDDAIYNLEYCDGYNFYYNYDLDEVTYNCQNAKSTLEYVR